MQELRLFALSRSQFDATRRAVECWSSSAKTVWIQPRQDKVSFRSFDEDPSACDKQQADTLGDMEQSLTPRTTADTGKLPETTAADNPSSCTLPLAALQGEEIGKAIQSDEFIHNYQLESTVYAATEAMPKPSVEVTKFASEHLREQIAAARKSLLLVLKCSSSPQMHILTATEQEDQTAAAKFDSEFQSNITEIGLYLNQQLEMQAGDVALLAGLDTAVVREINHFVKEYVRLCSRSCKIEASDQDSCEETATTTSNPVVLSEIPKSLNFSMVSAQEVGSNSSREAARLTSGESSFAGANAESPADQDSKQSRKEQNTILTLQVVVTFH